MAENSRNASDDIHDQTDHQGAPAIAPGATEVRTNDPITVAPVSGPPPERAVAFQTAGLSPPATDYSFPGSAGVVQCEDRGQKHQAKQVDDGPARGKQRHEKREMDQSRKHKRRNDVTDNPDASDDADADDDTDASEEHDSGDDDHRRRRHQKRQGPARRAKKTLERAGRKMPRWPSLLITCVLSLVCGLVGAWGYSALFGASKSDDEGKSSDNGGKSSEKGGGSAKSGGGKSGGSDSDQSSQIKGLKTNLEDLHDGITQLTARLDRLTESIMESRLPNPEYFAGTSRIARMAPADAQSPPILPNALPTQMNVLERKVNQMSDLPARIRALEELVLSVREEIQALGNARRTSP
jgi:hypothetical protein